MRPVMVIEAALFTEIAINRCITMSLVAVGLGFTEATGKAAQRTMASAASWITTLTTMEVFGEDKETTALRDCKPGAGACVGTTVGIVGECVAPGSYVGLTLGPAEGRLVGRGVGAIAGTFVGLLVGKAVGKTVEAFFGATVGDTDGMQVGGAAVELSLGSAEGAGVGSPLKISDGM